MNFGKFTLFNCIGGIAWVSLFVLVGYFFGGIPLVQDHFEVIVLGIVAVSVAPAIIGAVKAAMSSRKKKTADGRTQAQAEIDAELVEELELRGAHAAVEEGLSGKHAAPVAKAVQEMPHGAHAKAESETE